MLYDYILQSLKTKVDPKINKVQIEHSITKKTSVGCVIQNFGFLCILPILIANFVYEGRR